MTTPEPLDPLPLWPLWCVLVLCSILLVVRLLQVVALILEWREGRRHADADEALRRFNEEDR